MDKIEQLHALYDEYSKTAKEVRKKAPAFAGILGMGNDPRRHSCHDAFYQAVEQWVNDFMNSQPETEQVIAATRWILEAAQHYRNEETYWFVYAAQGHTRSMIPLLPQQECEALRQWYSDTYPLHDRLPVQNEIYGLLQQYSGHKEIKKTFLQKLFGKKDSR